MDRVIQEIRHMFISSIILVTSRVFYYIFKNSTWGIFATANNNTSFDPMVIITNTIAILSVIIFVFSLIRFITGLLGYEPNIKLTTSIHIEIPIIKQKKFGRVSVKKVIIKLPGTFTYDQVKEVQKIIERPINAIFIKIHNSDDQDVEKKLYGTYAALDWCKLPDKILVAAERLRGVQIENRSAIDLIKKFNYKDVLIYCDPPYMLETRHCKQYRYEMDKSDHEELLCILKRHSGQVIISGYDTELYNRELRSWNRMSRTAYTQSGTKKEEVIWMNFDPPNQQITFDI